MKTFELIAPCHFGLEAVTKKEIIKLGYEVTEVTDGRVSFTGDADAIARANIFLRTTERVLLKVGSFRAETWEDLFQGTKSLPWENFIPKDGSFWVTKASSIKSKLFSTRDIQSVMKKAMVARMGSYYGVDWFEEHGAKYPVRVFAYKDVFTVCLDTSGESLHKRGYRLKQGLAPITETLAAALIMQSGWREDHAFVDPMCGSGTFVIEAAMMAAHIAPGMDRAFVSEAWTNLIEKKCWYRALEEANEDIDEQLLETGINRYGKKVDIQGYDINPEVIPVARENAERAGVERIVHLQVRDIAHFSHGGKYGYFLTNPPYGERIEDKRNLPLLYTELREAYQSLDSWSMHLITAWEDAQKYLGKADKNRKIYNGMMKTYFYSYDKRYFQHAAPHDFRAKRGAQKEK
ncbi:MAG TPA: RNA methyltransferase [Oribacterium sp.]|nr:RNA methyltransferase [Oribacterium sp.]